MMMMIVIYCSFSETNRANLLYLSIEGLQDLGLMTLELRAGT